MSAKTWVDEDLKGWDVSREPHMGNGRFEKWQLQGANLVERTTRSTVFDRCDFREAGFNSSLHGHSAFLNAVWDGGRQVRGDWSYTNLRYADHRGASRARAPISLCRLLRCILRLYCGHRCHVR